MSTRSYSSRFAPQRLAMCLASSGLLMPAIVGAQTAYSTPKIATVLYEPGGPQRNGFEKASIDVSYRFGDCYGIRMQYAVKPTSLSAYRIYWLDGKRLNVPETLRPETQTSVRFQGRIQGVNPQEFSLIASTQGDACAFSYEIGKSASYWGEKATLQQKEFALNGLGVVTASAGYRAPALTSPAIERHFRDQWTQARRDSANRAAEARRDSVQRVRVAQAQRDSAARAAQARRQADASSGTSAAGAASSGRAGAVNASGDRAIGNDGRTSTASSQPPRQSAADEARSERDRREEEQRRREAAELARRQAQVDAEADAIRQRGEQAAVALPGMIETWMGDRRAQKAREEQNRRRAAAAHAQDQANTRATAERARAARRAAAASDPRYLGPCSPLSHIVGTLRPGAPVSGMLTYLDCRSVPNTRNLDAYRFVVDTAGWYTLSVTASFAATLLVGSGIDVIAGGTSRISHHFERGEYTVIVWPTVAAGDVDGPYSIQADARLAGVGISDVRFFTVDGNDIDDIGARRYGTRFDRATTGIWMEVTSVTSGKSNDHRDMSCSRNESAGWTHRHEQRKRQRNHVSVRQVLSGAAGTLPEGLHRVACWWDANSQINQYFIVGTSPGSPQAERYAGIGAAIRPVDGGAAVTSVFAGGPAEKAGLDARDLIVAIEGWAAAGMPADSVVARLKGASGTVVALTVHRDGNPRPLHVEVTRGEIVVSDAQRRGIAIPALQATLVGMRVWENGAGSVPVAERQYARRFGAATARRILWDFEFDLPPGAAPATAYFACTLHRDGSAITEFPRIRLAIEQGQRSATWTIGAGWPTPGNWSPGTYRMDCTSDGQLFGSTTFEMI